MADAKEFYAKHKVAVLVVGGVTVGLVGYSFLKRGSSSAAAVSTPTAAAGSGTTSPSQYLIPYSAYYGGGTPSGGSVGTSTTSTTATSPSGVSSSSGSGAGSGSGSTAPTTTTAPTSPTRSIPYNQPTYHQPTTPSHTYAALTNFAAAQQINRQSPGKVYWRAANGVMEVWNPKEGGAPTGSTLYVSSS